MWTITTNRSWQQLEEKFDWVRDMKEVPQDKIHHAEGNVDVHTQMVLAAMERDALYQSFSAQDQQVLWASALLHDVEKRSTTTVEPDGRITSAGHARKGAQTARVILYRDVPTPFHIREQIVALVKYHSLPLWLLEKRDPLKTAIAASLEVNMKWLALLARADVLGRTANDQADLLYRIDCFKEFCKEHHCWDQPRSFASPLARFHYLQKDGHPDYVPFEQPVTQVIVMSGLPGAGKDNYIRQHFHDLPVISLDGIRQERQTAATDKTGNGQAIQAAKEKAREYLRRKRPFVWNATNTTHQMRTQLIDLFLAYKAEVKIIYVEVPYERLHKQNKNRQAVVPAAVLDKLVRKLEVPVAAEAHEVIWHIH